MTKHHKRKSPPQSVATKRGNVLVLSLAVVVVLILVAAFFYFRKEESVLTQSQPEHTYQPTELWLQRAYAVDKLFHRVYTPGWEGAYGAIGDAYLFAATLDSALLRFHLHQHNLTRLYDGYWVDDRAWAALAELIWWEMTGKKNAPLVTSAARRYTSARDEGRLSNHEGFWTWYNWPPHAEVNEKIFTNSNMNQMATVACKLYQATGEQQYLDEALRVWNDVEKKLYKGNGRWEGRPGRAAFGKELPWHGTEYCAIGAALFRATGDARFKRIVVATAKHILDPSTGWVDRDDYYQIHMDGNGAFVNFLLDAYMIAPDELADIPAKVEKMLDHVWTNHRGTATVTLHRETDHGIRNGWNPNGGEDGYGVGEIGTVHAQGEAARAFGVFAFVKYAYRQNYQTSSTEQQTSLK
ncbi:MAG: hypothetical protein HY961_21635 [Ignavibacteriae bacterium]|nr:hypothetical protein [Ignavibacteriota bacterium]